MNCITTHNIALFCLRPVNPVRHKFQAHSAPSRTSEGQSSLPVDFLGDRVKSEHRSMFFGEKYDPSDRFLSPTLPFQRTRTTTLDTCDLFGMWDSGSPRLNNTLRTTMTWSNVHSHDSCKIPYLQFKCAEPNFKVKTTAEYTGETSTVATHTHTHTQHVLSSATQKLSTILAGSTTFCSPTYENCKDSGLTYCQAGWQVST